MARAFWLLLLVSLQLIAQAIPTPTSLGSVTVGSTGSAIAVTVTMSNQGMAPSLSLRYGQDFSLGSVVCTGSGTVTCIAQVSLRPIYPGLRQDAILAKDSNGYVISAIPVNGIGQGAALAILPPLISTLAGDQVFAFAGDQGPALTASFGYPQGIATDQIGNVYIADYLNGSIRKIDAGTQVITTVAGMGQWGYSGDNGLATAAKLAGPVGMAFDPAGNLFVADSGNNVIRKIDANGIITTVVGSGGSTGIDGIGDSGPAIGAVVFGPLGIAFDAAGNLYIADSQDNLVRRVDAQTGIINIFAGGGNNPGTDGFGNGGPAVGCSLAGPSGVAVDQSGNVLIADTGNSMIRKVDSTNHITRVAGVGSPGFAGDGALATQAMLFGPNGVTVDAAQNVYIADSNNNVIRKVNAASGLISTVAGVPAAGYAGDGGSAKTALLYSPMGIALNGSGEMFIADYGNNVIRKLTANAGSLHFPTLNAGTTGGVQQVVVANTGNVTTSAPALTVSSGFQLRSSDPTLCQLQNSLAPGATCTASALFAPPIAGTYAGSLSVGTQIQISLSGAADGVARSAVSPSLLSFGSIAMGSVSAGQTITLSNVGTAPLTVGNISPALSDFTLQTDACSGTMLAPGANCALHVQFSPQAIGPRATNLTVPDSTIDSPHMVSLSGVGLGVANIIPPAAVLTFSAQVIGTTSAGQTVALHNGGTAAQAMAIGIAGNIDFVQSNTCGIFLGAGASCQIAVTFTPLALGSRSGTLALFTDSSGTPRSVALNGVGLGVANVSFSPSTLSFSNLAIGRTSAGQTVTLHNGGTAAQSMAIGLTGNNDFAESNTCGSSLAVGASCQVTVTFYPAAIGSRSGTLALFTDSSGTLRSVALSGIALGVANVSISASTLSFNNLAIGRTSAGQTVALYNGGTAAQSMAISLTGNSDFVQSNTCGASLAAGASCQITVTFYPAAVGNRSATLGLFTDSSGASRSVALSGVGLGVANVTVAATVLTFNSQVIVTASAGQTVALQNGGTAAQPMAIGLITGNSDFVQGNTCGASLAAGASCQVTVTFYPAAVGSRSGTLALFTDSSGTPRSIALSGTAAAPVPSCGGLGLGASGPSTRIGAVHAGTYFWSLDNNGSACPSTQSIQFGGPGDIPIVGDWSGNGKTKAGVWLVAGGIGQFYLDTNGNGWDGDRNFTWGQAGDIPVVGDWNGDGTSKVGVFRPSTGYWILDFNNSHDISQATQIHFGSPGDVPIVGDWDGTHRSKVGVWRPSMPGFFLHLATGDWNPFVDVYFLWGQTGDIPVVGDWNGSGASKIGVFRAAQGFWYLDGDNSHHMPTVPLHFGSPGDVPVVGDWSGIGKTYIGVWRPTSAGFWLDVNGNGYDSVDKFLPWADSSAIPLVGRW